MIRLSSVGYRRARFLPGQSASPGFADGLGRDQLVAATTMVDEAVADGGVMLFIVPSWAAEPACRRLELIRSSLATSRLVVYRCGLPPLAGAALVALADALRAHVDTPGRLIGALPALEQELVTLARLQRLTKLVDPPTTVWQHAVSLLPWTTFGVATAPEPTVTRLTRERPLMPLPELDRTRAMAVAYAAHGGASPEWARERLLPALGSLPSVEAVASPQATTWWGSSPGIEAVIYPTDLDETARSVTKHVLLRRCGSCGLDSPSDICPYCGVHEPRPLDVDVDEGASDTAAV